MNRFKQKCHGECVSLEKKPSLEIVWDPRQNYHAKLEIIQIPLLSLNQMWHLSPNFFIAYQIIASTTRHWLFLHVAHAVFSARTFLFCLHWTIEKEYSLCPNCQPPLASGESRFPFDWHLLYPHETTPITGSRNGLLVRALTAMGSTEK